jgi:hypothetical protein
VHGAVGAGWDVLLGVVRTRCAHGQCCGRWAVFARGEGAVDDGRARGEGGEKGGLLQCTTRLCAGCDAICVGG